MGLARIAANLSDVNFGRPIHQSHFASQKGGDAVAESGDARFWWTSSTR